MNERNTLLAVENLRTSYRTTHGTARAVDNVSFNIDAGEILGIVGESGCGKTATALSVLRLIDPPGRIEAGSHLWFEGHDLLTLDEEAIRQVRGRRIAMVFQEPMTALNPVFTVGDQVAEVVRVHTSATRREAWARAVAMLDRVGIPEPAIRARSYPHQLSGGLRQRVLIAMALVMRPALLIADEPTTALDVTIQAQILELLQELQREMGMAVMLITHDLGVVAEVAQRVIVMYAGQVVEEAGVQDLFSSPRHPYTRGLLRAMPRARRAAERLQTIPGTVPSPTAWPAGCRFRDRCADAFEPCGNPPDLFDLGGGHRARCFLTQVTAATAPTEPSMPSRI
ncbi:MAG: Dipeptide transport ATP-binding protein DppD [Gemmatimonadaceae bacterium]|nr:Dipeptide transport ATP-binding protein DppD [Gemmatimonadaceae bacterium]